jgi:hypothetical protein
MWRGGTGVQKIDDLAATCPHCGKVKILKVEGSFTQSPDDDRGIEEPYKVLLVSCGSCSDVALYTRYLEQLGTNEWDWSDPKLLWPSTGPTALPSDVPRKISAAFAQAQQCFSLGMHEPAAIMARKSIELACEDQGYGKGHLVDRIKTMVKDGKLESRLADWANALREVGNEGAHGKPQKQDVSDALMFARALFEYIYVLNVAYERFAQRRNMATS